MRGRDSSTAWPFRDDNTFSTDDFIRAHHFIVFVLENVAVPNITEFISRVDLGSRGQIEARNDTCDVARIGLDRIFPGGAFVRFGRHGDAGEDELAGLHVRR